MQQLQWCRRIDANAKAELQRPRTVDEVMVLEGRFLQRYMLHAEWNQRFLGAQRTPLATKSGNLRQHSPELRGPYSAVDVHDLLLAVYGRSVGPSGDYRRRTVMRTPNRWWGKVLVDDHASCEEQLGEQRPRRAPVEASPVAGCPTLLATDSRLRCSRCAQIRQVATELCFDTHRHLRHRCRDSSYSVTVVHTH